MSNSVMEYSGIEPEFAQGFGWLSAHLSGYQYGESGLLAALCFKLGRTGKFVEFGAGADLSCRPLLGLGWQGLVIEADEKVADALREQGLPGITVVNGRVEPTGDGRLDVHLTTHGYLDADVVVIDVDSMDWHIFDSLTACQPAIVMVEHHDLTDPLRKRFQPAPAEGECGQWTDNGYTLQATHRAVAMLGSIKGYSVAAMTRCNTVMFRNDLANVLGEFGSDIRLNLGAGRTVRPGFTNVDIKDGQVVYPLADYADGSVSEIYASHVLEHFPGDKTIKVLREWVRVLKPGGRIRVAVPDHEKAIKMLQEGKIGFNLFESYIMGGHTDDNDHHGSLFNAQKLAALMHYVGLEHVVPWESYNRDCASLEVSLNLEGVKRGFEVKENPRVIAVLSVPRVGFTDMWKATHRALRTMTVKSIFHGGKEPLVDDLVECGGAFWEKFLTAGIKHAMKLNPDYLLFIDGDSVFDPQDVEKLIEVLQKDATLSAAFAVQVSRHNDRPLVHVDAETYKGESTEVQLGHFGLTVVRAKVFTYLQKPWLWSMPNPETLEWDEKGHCDADITFWRVLKEFGHKVVQVNAVQAGHMDLCIKWLTPKGIAYQPLKHYWKHGKPKDAVFDPAVYAQQAVRPELNGKA
jgi:SAM-dependent methyltransferase